MPESYRQRCCAKTTKRSSTPARVCRRLGLLVLDLRSRGTGYPQPGAIDGDCMRAPSTYLRTYNESSLRTYDPKGTGHGTLRSVPPSHIRSGYRHNDLGLAFPHQTRERGEIRCLGFICFSGPCHQAHHPGPTQSPRVPHLKL